MAPRPRLRHSREGAPASRPDVRVKPGGLLWRWPRAASRARWPDAAQTKHKSWRTYSVPTAWVNRRCGGRVLGETQHRAIEGIAGAHTKSPSAAVTALRGRTLTERPRNPAVQAGFKAHVRSRAKCMPVAPQRGHPTRAKRPTFTPKRSVQPSLRKAQAFNRHFNAASPPAPARPPPAYPCPR